MSVSARAYPSRRVEDRTDLTAPVDLRPLRRRTDTIVEAVRAAIEHQSAALNHPDFLVRAIHVSIKIKNGTIVPRAVVLSIETEHLTGA
jgi:hypothetical protein